MQIEFYTSDGLDIVQIEPESNLEREALRVIKDQLEAHARATVYFGDIRIDGRETGGLKIFTKLNPTPPVVATEGEPTAASA